MPRAEGALNITSPGLKYRTLLGHCLVWKLCSGSRMKKEDLAVFALKGDQKSWVVQNENLITESDR